MAAFMKLKDVEGAATDKEHDKWVIIESMSAPIYRTIQEGAKDMQRSRGGTTIGDVVVVRELDKSSTKLSEACATGKYFADVEVHLCNEVKGKNVPYLEYKLYDVIITSYSVHGSAEGKPTEQVTMNYTKVDWTYNVINSKTGDKEGKVATSYNPGEHKA